MLAQTLAQMAADLQPLTQYGLVGTVLGWFMYMATKVPAAIHKASEDATGKIQVEFQNVMSELKSVSHRTDGLTRAMLMDLVNRDSIGPLTRAKAQEEIAKIDARMPR